MYAMYNFLKIFQNIAFDILSLTYLFGKIKVLITLIGSNGQIANLHPVIELDNTTHGISVHHINTNWQTPCYSVSKSRVRLKMYRSLTCD